MKAVKQLTNIDLETNAGIYNNVTLPLKILITQKDNSLCAEATNQDAAELIATGHHVFRFDSAGKSFEFKPRDKKIIFKLGGESINIVKSLFVLVFYIFFIQIGLAQNLPSLLLNRNINATFSIIAFDKEKQEWGIAVATNNIYVGNSTIYIEPGVGAFSTIAETEPAYAYNGLEKLKQGKTIEQAILFTKNTDEEFYNRQVAGIDNEGNVYAFTGEALKYWLGTSSHTLGKNYVVLGNQLADHVLTLMATTFENAPGTLAERLLISLIAGQNAGGQLTGKQSAALVVKGIDNEWFNQIDLRVDNSNRPFVELQKLLDYHYGRILLNQSIFAIKMGNNKRGETLLLQAQELVKGWNGIYSKLAMAYILLGKDEKAVPIIQQALDENPDWKKNLPAFYCLKHLSEIKNLLRTDTFSLKDWQIAIHFMLNLNQTKKAIDLGIKILQKYPNSSFLYYLLGKAYNETGDVKAAKVHLTRALFLDNDNAEAQKLLEALNRK